MHETKSRIGSWFSAGYTVVERSRNDRIEISMSLESVGVRLLPAVDAVAFHAMASKEKLLIAHTIEFAFCDFRYEDVYLLLNGIVRYNWTRSLKSTPNFHY